MRTLLLITLTLAALAAGFGAFLWAQGGVGSGVGTSTVGVVAGPVRVPDNQSGVVGASRDGWTETYDKKTGRLAMMFRADRFAPAGGRTMDVARPTAKIFTADGYVQLVAASGKIDFPQAAGLDKFQSSVPAGLPERGELFDVTLALYETADAARPVLTARLNNVTFDNNTFRIATAAANIGGREVPADQIPVIVRGRDLDFDGRGLVLRWSEADRRLALLEIAHGGVATIKNAAAMVPPNPPQSAAPSAALAAPLPDALASADRRALPPLDPPQSAPTPAVGPAYRSTFLTDVRIAQDGERVASADQLLVDFATEKQAAPTPEPSKKRRKKAAADPTTGPSTEPATRPAGPIVIEWTGPLRVVPLPADLPAPKSADDRTIRLLGDPAVVRRDGADVRAGEIVYRTLDGTGTLDGGAFGEVAVARPDADVRTDRIAFDPAGATLLGTSRATLPDPKTGRPVTARWTDRCRLDFRDGPGGPKQIRSARMAGGVDVALPELRLAADQLDLAFGESAPPATRPATTPATSRPTTSPTDDVPPLQRIDARGSVRCVVTNQKPDALGGPPLAASQRINADELTVLTKPGPDGRPVPDTITARGNIHALGDGQELWADALDAAIVQTAAPTAPGKPGDPGGPATFALGAATATGRVRAALPNGAAATADRLHVDAPDSAGEQVVTLTGAPDNLATLSDPTSRLAGPVIVLRPVRGTMLVDGAGTMRGLSKPAGGGEPKAVDVAWSNRLTLNGPADRIDLLGGISAVSTDADGTVSTATADAAVLTLAPDPTKKPATRPADPRTAGFAALADKTLSAGALQGSVELKSVLKGPDGVVLRRTALQAARAEVDATGKRFVVPVPGRLLYEDHRPAAAPQNAGQKPDALAGYRGATAASWQRQMSFDQSTGRVSLLGDVRIARSDANPAANGAAPNGPGPLRLTADAVSAILKPAGPPNGQPAAPGSPDKFDLTQAAAEGNVVMKTPTVEFLATRAAYDAATGRVVAADGNLAAGLGASRGRFRELWYNARTDQIDKLTGLTATARPGK